MQLPVSLSDVEAAAGRIAKHTARTCVVRDWETADCELYFKCEQTQPGGAFKLRGAFSAVCALPENVRHVVTHSSGNHGQALARAARATGRRATVVVPRNAIATKIKAMHNAGAHVIRCESTQQAREDGLARVLAESEAIAIPPYDHDQVIAGQGTATLELLDQINSLDVVYVPCGGGGLLAGAAVVARALRPDLSIIGVEPAGADDAARSLADGQIVSEHQPQTCADGLRAKIGERNFAILHRLEIPIVTVSEHNIVSALRWVATRMRWIIEPSAAVAVAGWQQTRSHWKGKRVGIMLTGSNVDLPWWLDAVR